MTTVDFLPFANDAAANVVTQATYLAAATGGYGQYGFSAGIAPSNQLNKVWRQSSVMTAALANMVSTALTANVLDSGGAASVTALQAQLVSAIQAVAVSALPPVTPQGRLTLTAATPVILSDVASSSVVYYTACTGNYVPVWNGTSFTNLAFATDLTLTLTAAAAANGIVDVFCINVGGVLTIGFGPVWGTATPGAGARGSGAGTTALQRILGLLVNANVITLLNGVTTYANVPAGQATYLGSVSVDAVAGQTTCRVSYGQSRKWGVWNAYNRRQIMMQAGDPTASWTSVPAVWRASNNAAANSISAFTGLAEEIITTNFLQNMGANNRVPKIGLGWNSTAAPAGTQAAHVPNSGILGQTNELAVYNAPPSLGLNTVTGLENGSGDTNGVYYGTQTNMLLSVAYQG
jgi:hypothetical protein